VITILDRDGSLVTVSSWDSMSTVLVSVLFKVLIFGFETCIKIVSPLINRSINEALLGADYISFRCHCSSSTFFIGFWFQSVSPGAGALVWFSCSNGWKWMVHRTIVWRLAAQTVAVIHLSSCWWLTFQFTMHAQENRAAVTQDSRLHTRHAASQ